MKNQILEVLIREARNVCRIPDKQFKLFRVSILSEVFRFTFDPIRTKINNLYEQQMIQITEQLTENCFTNIKFNHTTFRFHPNKTVDEIRQRLLSDNDQTELMLTVRREKLELIIDQPNCVLADLNLDEGLEARSILKSSQVY